MAAVRLQHLSCGFASGTLAVDDVSFELASGEFFCLLGPSGSGKSTLLRLIGGYLEPAAGSVWINDREVTKVPPERRNAGMVFQNYALFPHLSALDNVAFGLRVKGVSKVAREAKAHEMLDWVGLTHNERHRRPVQLSGGQQQRVALARALAFGPSLLMLDEPFANLDRSLRERLREEMREVQRRAGITTILVTHDRDEALALGDRIAVMDQGRVLQLGTPEDVYRQPANTTVASFLGHRNVLNAEASGKCGLEGIVMLWPERLRLQESGGHPGIIRRAAFTGSHRVLNVNLDNGVDIEVHTPHDTNNQVNDKVRVDIPAGAVTRIPGA
ncbi:MAG: cysA 2 [Verrucomicrobiaceae bacterium]|nr:cysA 2 [Verrucomicrobiaceae bacterium]